MKLGQQLSKLLNLMQLSEDVLCNIGKFKAMNPTNFCRTSNLVSYHWREVLHLGLKNLRKKNLKHDCLSAEENELSK